MSKPDYEFESKMLKILVMAFTFFIVIIFFKIFDSNFSSWRMIGKYDLFASFIFPYSNVVYFSR